MKSSSIFLVATCVLMVESNPSDSTTYAPPSTGSTEGNTNCPSSLTYGRGTQKYRFVDNVNSLASPQYLPCTGDIDSCVYTAHKKFYCMMGNKPDYTPWELNPHTDRVTYQNISTFAGSFDVGPNEQPGIKSFITADGREPLISIKLFPNDYARRLVWGGFILKTFKRGGGTTSYPRGFTDQLSYARNEYIYLEIGDQITEAFGWVGAVIGQITFGVTPNPTDPHNTPTFYSAGSATGLPFDATPDPSLNGPCELVSLSGKTSTTFEAQTVPAYIRAVEFHWQCVGKPLHYVH